jgi:hypothetical protein
MSLHAYPRSAAAADLVRAGLGCAFALTPFVAASPPPDVAAALLAMLGIFAALGWRGVLLLFIRIEVGAAGVSVSGLLSGILGPKPTSREVPWRDLRRVKLAYYATRRDGRSGWLQLTLESADRARLCVDSRLDGFRHLALAAAKVAVANHLALDPPTRSNFQALGIAIDEQAPAGRAP